jgi:hypothetical protein
MIVDPCDALETRAAPCKRRDAIMARRASSEAAPADRRAGSRRSLAYG